MSHANVQPHYRPDVDGLRAIAVIVVVVFHAFPTVAPGGFIGVDVFFVISGFLISSIVFASLEKGSFSFADFYARRIRRIFPALLLVLAATWIAGWRFLYPLEFGNLGKHVAGGAAFVSNILFWRDAGYFDTAAEQKPLLHLWSLAIEEQFYMVWPVTLVLAWKLPRLRVALIVAALAISFVLCVWLTERDPTAAYYFPLTRFWELLVGALLAYATVVHRPAAATGRPWSWPMSPDARAALGLALIAIALFAIDKDTPFPGWRALLPTLGTMLLISAGGNTVVARQLLSRKLVVGVGLISYPLYLWHWPLLSLGRIVDGGAHPERTAALAVLAAFPLSWLTFRFVEKPIRHQLRTSTTVALGVAMTGCLVLGVAANLAWLPGHFESPATRALADAQGDWNYPGANDRTLRVGAGDPRVLFIGDSHIQQYYPRVKWLVDHDKAPTTEFYTRGGCPPLPLVNRRDRGYRCDDFVAAAMTLATNSPRVETVVIGGAWEIYFSGILPREKARGPLLYSLGDALRSPIGIDSPEAARSFAGLAEEIRRLRAANKRVIVVLNNPTSEDYSPARRYPDRVSGVAPVVAGYTDRKDFEAFARNVNARVVAAARAGGAEIIDPLDYLCDASRCPTIDATGLPLYIDSNHLRATVVRDGATFIDQVYGPAAPAPASGSATTVESRAGAAAAPAAATVSTPPR